MSTLAPLSDDEAWVRYKRLLSRSSTNTSADAKLPGNLPHRISLTCGFDYVPPAEFMNCLRTWLVKRGALRVFYFITETADGTMPTDFAIPVSELTSENLCRINPGAESVMVAQDFTWAIFVDHEGRVHAAGPKDLMAAIVSACSE